MNDASAEYVPEKETTSGRFLIFFLGNESFGLEIERVIEIVGIQKINSMPESPEFLKGVINLRGKIIPVTDMRIKLKKDAKAYTDRTCIIVTELKHTLMGLIVDAVDEVVTISAESIVPPPGASSRNPYIRGIAKIGENLMVLLDSELLFEEME